jgi:hypothetical protein
VAHQTRPWKRYLLANWRDMRVLLRQFYMPLLLFAVSVLLGGLCFDVLYTHTEVQDLTYVEAVYDIFSMIFFGASVPFPNHWYLQAFFFVMPVVGLGLIAQGVRLCLVGGTEPAETAQPAGGTGLTWMRSASGAPCA